MDHKDLLRLRDLNRCQLAGAVAALLSAMLASGSYTVDAGHGPTTTSCTRHELSSFQETSSLGTSSTSPQISASCFIFDSLAKVQQVPFLHKLGTVPLFLSAPDTGHALIVESSFGDSDYFTAIFICQSIEIPAEVLLGQAKLSPTWRYCSPAEI